MPVLHPILTIKAGAPPFTSSHPPSSSAAADFPFSFFIFSFLGFFSVASPSAGVLKQKYFIQYNWAYCVYILTIGLYDIFYLGNSLLNATLLTKYCTATFPTFF